MKSCYCSFLNRKHKVVGVLKSVTIVMAVVAVVICLLCVLYPATREMVQILQDYGGVVCCFGSSASVENTAVFLQADCRLHIFTSLICNRARLNSYMI